MNLCSLLTSRNPGHDYEAIIEQLMVMLKIKAFESTLLLHVDTSEILGDMEEIFTNRLMDQNYIGFINIILLQCVIAFTRRYKIYNRTYDECLKIEWKNSEALKNLIKENNEFEEVIRILLQDKEGREYTLENIVNPSMNIFLVRWIDVFSSDEFIRGYFLNIHYGEVITTKRWADAEYMVPFDFLEHDIGHANADFCIQKQHYDSVKMNHFFNFYKHCATLDKEKFRKIRVYIFLQIHEGGCYLDPNAIKNTTTVFMHFLNTLDESQYSDSSGYDVARLSNKHDLLGMVPANRLVVTPNDIALLPKKDLDLILESIEGISPDLFLDEFSDITQILDRLPKYLYNSILATVRRDKIKQYLFECILLYKLEYDSWKSEESRKSIKSNKTRKSTKSNKTRKSRLKGCLKGGFGKMCNF